MAFYNSDARIVRHIAADDEAGDELFARFNRLDVHLVDKVHPSIGQGSALSDRILLTDHGPEHISTVIRRIGDLTFDRGEFKISPYEAYLLAVAAHFHDVGNVYGRHEHERRTHSELFSLEHELTGEDTIEKRKIAAIAQAHGGRIDGSKDTINALPDDKTLRKLAAILRFADELADDHTRTSKKLRDILGESEEARKESEIYHLYADRLRDVYVDHRSRGVKLCFEVLPCHLCQQYWKDGERRYLIDEIFERTLKVHREQVYCGKFMVPDIVSEVTDVEISVCSASYENILGRFHYTLEQTGYPDHISDFGVLVADYGLSDLEGYVVADGIGEVLKDAADLAPGAQPVDLNAFFGHTTSPVGETE